MSQLQRERCVAMHPTFQDNIKVVFARSRIRNYAPQAGEPPMAKYRRCRLCGVFGFLTVLNHRRLILADTANTQTLPARRASSWSINWDSATALTHDRSARLQAL